MSDSVRAGRVRKLLRELAPPTSAAPVDAETPEAEAQVEDDSLFPAPFEAEKKKKKKKRKQDELETDIPADVNASY